MSKVSIERVVLMDIYCQKYFGQNIDDASQKISQNLGISPKRVREIIFDLRAKNAITVKDNILYENKKNQSVVKSFSKVKKHKVNGNEGFSTKQFKIGEQYLCTILKDDDGKIYAKPHRKSFGNCLLLNDENLTNDDIGKTCLIEIKKTDEGIRGEILQTFGFADDPILENVAIAASHGFTTHFQSKVLEEARAISPYVTDEQKIGRVDMRNKEFVTIDPPGCKDKDDAIYDEKLPDGSVRTYIAIADVSSGVVPGTELDKEAFKRGNSCYLGGGVYPMLPKELSNGIFSLDENKERLAVVVSAIVKGKTYVNPRVDIAVIKVKKSYSYPEAEDTHLSKNGFEKKNASTKRQIDLLYENTPLLEKRYAGMLEPDSHEPEYKFSADGKVVENVKLSNDEYSHKVVETRMLLANEIVAGFFMERGLAGIFRVHEKSRPDKFAELKQKLATFGIKYNLENTTASYKKLVEEVRESPARDYLMFEIIRSMSKAKYKGTVNQTEHFGLDIAGNRGYMHFTSPIRRYADLMTHRLLKDILQKRKIRYTETELDEIAQHLNTQEKEANNAEIESDAYLACIWAQKHADEIQSGKIVKISKNYVEVLHSNGTTRLLMPISKLKNGDITQYKIAGNQMSISNGHQTYNLGEDIDFAIDEINLNSRTIFATTELERIKNRDSNLNFEFKK